MRDHHERKRVLIVTRNLPPLVGGMERLNWHMAEELARRAEVRAIAPAGAAKLAPAGVSVVEAPLKPLSVFLLVAVWRACLQALAFRPDVVLAGSGLTAPIAWLASRLAGAKAMAYVHGLDVATRHPVYRALWRPALRWMDVVIANSASTRELCLGIGVNPSRIEIIHPGVQMPDTMPDHQAAAEEFCQQFGGAEGPFLLSVGRLSERKGLRQFVEQALPAIVTRHPGAMLVVVGDAPKQAISAQAQTIESIQRAADAIGLGAHLRFLGQITDFVRLGKIYAAADVHVFPVRQLPGDPEGFGMVAVEAAAHGLPTVAFATGGVVDAVVPGESGHLAEADDYPGLVRAVEVVLKEGATLRWRCMMHARRFAWSSFGRQISRVCLNVSIETQLDGAG